MTDRTITLRTDLIERLEALAHEQGRSVDEVFGELLEQYAPAAASTAGNWALTVAEGMEAADIDWQNDPDASERSREHFERHLHERWLHTQMTDTDDAGHTG